jgi:hypothetical protein
MCVPTTSQHTRGSKMVGTSLRAFAHPTIMPNVFTKERSCGSLFAKTGNRSVI